MDEFEVFLGLEIFSIHNIEIDGMGACDWIGIKTNLLDILMYVKQESVHVCNFREVNNKNFWITEDFKQEDFFCMGKSIFESNFRVEKVEVLYNKDFTRAYSIKLIGVEKLIFELAVDEINIINETEFEKIVSFLGGGKIVTSLPPSLAQV